jgi:hypothetical protein
MATLTTFLRETCFLSNTLLDEFRLSHGYRTVAEMAWRLEREERDDTRLALKNLIYCIEELVCAGHAELKMTAGSGNTSSSAASSAMFKLEGFQMPTPSGRAGRTVRNVYAFHCLTAIFNKSANYDTCCHVLDAIKNLYQKDEYNYFILESQNLVLYSLDDSSMKIHIKAHEIQVIKLTMIGYSLIIKIHE